MNAIELLKRVLDGSNHLLTLMDISDNIERLEAEQAHADMCVKFCQHESGSKLMEVIAEHSMVNNREGCIREVGL